MRIDELCDGVPTEGHDVLGAGWVNEEVVVDPALLLYSEPSSSTMTEVSPLDLCSTPLQPPLQPQPYLSLPNSPSPSPPTIHDTADGPTITITDEDNDTAGTQEATHPVQPGDTSAPQHDDTSNDPTQPDNTSSSQHDDNNDDKQAHPRLILWNGIWTLRDEHASFHPPTYYIPPRPPTPSPPPSPLVSPALSTPLPSSSSPPSSIPKDTNLDLDLDPDLEIQDLTDHATPQPTTSDLLLEITLLQKHYAAEVAGLVDMHIRLDSELRALREEVARIGGLCGSGSGSKSTRGPKNVSSSGTTASRTASGTTAPKPSKTKRTARGPAIRKPPASTRKPTTATPTKPKASSSSPTSARVQKDTTKKKPRAGVDRAAALLAWETSAEIDLYKDMAMLSSPTTSVSSDGSDTPLPGTIAGTTRNKPGPGTSTKRSTPLR